MKESNDPKVTLSSSGRANERGVPIMKDQETKEEKIGGRKKMPIFGQFKFEAYFYFLKMSICF